MRRLVALLASPLSSVTGQAVPELLLRGQPTVVAEAFSDISQAVELADGRVVVYDAVERRLDLVDFARGQRQRLASQGAGPQEFRMIVAALRVPGDSVLLWDPANDRVLAIGPTGNVVGTWPAEGRSGRGVPLIRAYPRAADATGHLYALQQRPTDGDTATLLRLRVRDGATDTLARVPVPQLRPERAGAGVIRVRPPGFPALDAWAVFADGRVLIVRAAGYLPEILHPDGRRQRAAAVPFTPIAVTEAMRQAQLREAVREMQRRLLREAGGGRAVALPRVEAAEPASWPTQLPPIASTVVPVDSKQRAWVHVRDAGSGARYDLLDASGRRVASLRLPPELRLVALGRESVYAATEDEDGFLELRRYPLP